MSSYLIGKNLMNLWNIEHAIKKFQLLNLILITQKFEVFHYFQKEIRPFNKHFTD